MPCLGLFLPSHFTLSLYPFPLDWECPIPWVGRRVLADLIIFLVLGCPFLATILVVLPTLLLLSPVSQRQVGEERGHGCLMFLFPQGLPCIASLSSSKVTWRRMQWRGPTWLCGSIIIMISWSAPPSWRWEWGWMALSCRFPRLRCCGLSQGTPKVHPQNKPF